MKRIFCILLCAVILLAGNTGVTWAGTDSGADFHESGSTGTGTDDGAGAGANAGGTDVFAYQKGGTKPKVVVTFQGQVLKEGTDYTVRYKDNVAIANNERITNFLISLTF